MAWNGWTGTLDQVVGIIMGVVWRVMWIGEGRRLRCVCGFLTVAEEGSLRRTWCLKLGKGDAYYFKGRNASRKDEREIVLMPIRSTGKMLGKEVGR